MIKFSIIVPTRGRVPLLLNMLKSVEETAEDIFCVELIAIHDDDDIESKRCLEECQKPWIKILNRPQIHNVSDYYNWGVQFTTGRLIWAINDDAEILTNGWDKIIFEKMKEYDVALGSVWCPHYDQYEHTDEIKAAPFTYFPILTRTAVDKLGYLLPSYYSGWGADCVLYDIFHKHNKIVHLEEVRMKHITGRKLKDECYHHMEKITNIAKGGSFDLQKELEKLN